MFKFNKNFLIYILSLKISLLTVREFGIDMYTLLHLKWITNKDLLYSAGKSAQRYVAAWTGGELGENDTCIYVAGSFCCSPGNVTVLFISYTPK